jgi:hypothetical protein
MKNEKEQFEGWLGKADVLDDLQMGPCKRVSTVSRNSWLCRFLERQVPRSSAYSQLFTMRANLLPSFLSHCTVTYRASFQRSARIRSTIETLLQEPKEC